jgi:dTDP-4-amino-4,6-dideoxygalactose transaminase
MFKVNKRSLPRHPILGWSSFLNADDQQVSSIENLKHIAFTTSGRAAIYQALLQLALPPGSTVLVPSYHCPTMVAPIYLAHLKVAYFAITNDGLPNLLSIDSATSAVCKAILVPHYFGFANSLHEVRAWCDARNIALIEDCAHCYFGNAGARTVGAWGDYSTASLSKFFPVLEGGLLASQSRPIAKLQLAPVSFKDQFKSCIDIIEISSKYNSMLGINNLFKFIFKLKVLVKYLASKSFHPPKHEDQDMIEYCDMGRINRQLLWSSFLIKKLLPRNTIIKKRRENYLIYAKHFELKKGARPLFNSIENSNFQMSPYVFPLWVDDADRIYGRLKEMKLPVFRWDKIWPGTPKLAGDFGPLWSAHVLQLLCHQNLDRSEIDFVSLSIIKLLKD